MTCLNKVNVLFESFTKLPRHLQEYVLPSSLNSTSSKLSAQFVLYSFDATVMKRHLSLKQTSLGHIHFILVLAKEIWSDFFTKQAWSAFYKGFDVIWFT